MNRLREIQSIGVKLKETQAPASGSTARVYRTDPEPVNGVDINKGNVPTWVFLVERNAEMNQWPFWVEALDDTVRRKLQDLSFEGQPRTFDEREFQKWVEDATWTFYKTYGDGRRWDTSAVSNLWNPEGFGWKLRGERFKYAKERWTMEKPPEKPAESFNLPVRIGKPPCRCG